jgi:hypothetical protein
VFRSVLWFGGVGVLGWEVWVRCGEDRFGVGWG